MKKHTQVLFSGPFLGWFISLIIILLVVIIMNQQLDSYLNKINQAPARLVSPTPKFTSQLKEANEGLISRDFFELPVNQQQFEELSFLTSPNGQSFAYIVKRNDLEAVSLNGLVGPSYGKITFLKFSPDSQRLAYGVKTVSGKELVVIDGQEGTVYDWLLEPWFFTPDSQFFVYKARDSRGDVLVFNCWESSTYERIFNPVMDSSDNKIIFYGRSSNQLWRNQIDLK